MRTKLPDSELTLRFALLHHTLEAISGRGNHWDLMLERDGVLITLEVERLPSEARPFQVRRLADHRLAYLDYEGDVSNNRGHVIRLDRGRYEEAHVAEGSRGGQGFRYTLQGQRLNAALLSDCRIELIPLGHPVMLEAIQWEWHD